MKIIQLLFNLVGKNLLNSIIVVIAVMLVTMVCISAIEKIERELYE